MINTVSHGQYDYNDLIHVMSRLPSGVSIKHSIPSPVIKGRINPHMTRFVLSTGELCDVFHVKPIYYRHQNGQWRPLSEVMAWHGNRDMVLKEDWADKMEMAYLSWLLKRAEYIGGNVLIPSPYSSQPIPLTEKVGVNNAASISFATLTAYPDPNPETSTVDGYVDRNSASTTFSGLRTTTGNQAIDNGANGYPALLNSNGSGTAYQDMNRGLYLFDTSSIDDTATVSAGTFSLVALTGSKLDGFTNAQSLGITDGTTASNTALASSDYENNLSSTRHATDATISGITADSSTYTDWTLNATGLSGVNKTGVTKYCFKFSCDIDNADPGLPGGAQHQAGVAFYFAEQTGTDKDPKLTLTYSIVSASRNSLTLLGVS